MSDDAKHARSSKGAGSGALPPLDTVAIELATGLSIAEVDALISDPSPETRAGIAVKFAGELDRLANASTNKLVGDLLSIISKDAELLVRMRFAGGIKASPHLPTEIAKRLAVDEIDVAAPILRQSPVLDDAMLGEIITNMPESHAIAIAERKPLAAELVELLIEERGTKRVVARLLDNDEAEFSQPVLLAVRGWAHSDPDIDERLRRRPRLPFAFVNRCVGELADRVQWPSLSERMMTKFEATQLQSRFEGRTGHRCSANGGRFLRLKRTLKEEFDRGSLMPSSLLAFLRDGDIDRFECGFAVLTDLEVRWVRRLLYDSDRRALIALCLKAGFSTADYLAFRIMLGLAELGSVREQPKQRYSEKTLQFACDQFEAMRADPGKLKHWMPSAPS